MRTVTANGEHTRGRRVGAGVLCAGEAGAPHCVNAAAFTSFHAEGRSTPREW
ncbi:hypothetical protein OJ998_34185 [Solirubrobacter taibaiensis]|nr:hypothetical protein [Solirubrobacter taibaiensis]